ncbi:hypothetical protein [uncultured Ruegeria sp.]|uniref:hypothetical protein n=1 Tax=uncultured Ruegeria sp. TaxID=259304 RepID=UPI0026029E5A|nr:hypothetical protein [uncultured Ruegeria sp.]
MEEGETDIEESGPKLPLQNAKGELTEALELRYKKYELRLVGLGVLISLLGLGFLGWQLIILNKQTIVLTQSVYNQERSISSKDKMDDFGIKRFLLERFTPDVSPEFVEGRYSGEFEHFEFEWKVRNNGINRLAAANYFTFDFVRCFNRDFWTGAHWETFAEYQTAQDITNNDGEGSALLGLDLEKEKTTWVTLHSDVATPVKYHIPFSGSDYANFQEGERIGVQVLATIFDPDQSYFRDELEALEYRYGTQVIVKGRPLVFPAIVYTLSRVEMFELTSEGWSQIPSDESCTKFILEDTD